MSCDAGTCRQHLCISALSAELTGLSALQAGAMMLPVGLLQTICSPLAGIISCDRWTPKIPAIAGIAFSAVGYYLSSLLSLNTEPPLIYLSLCLRGVGLGIIFTPLMAYVMNEFYERKWYRLPGFLHWSGRSEVVLGWHILSDPDQPNLLPHGGLRGIDRCIHTAICGAYSFSWCLYFSGCRGNFARGGYTIFFSTSNKYFQTGICKCCQ